MTRIFHWLFLCERWIPCQASTSVLCLHYRPETVHGSTKDANTSEITFLVLNPWWYQCKLKVNLNSIKLDKETNLKWIFDKHCINIKYLYISCILCFYSQSRLYRVIYNYSNFNKILTWITQNSTLFWRTRFSDFIKIKIKILKLIFCDTPFNPNQHFTTYWSKLSKIYP